MNRPALTLTHVMLYTLQILLSLTGALLSAYGWWTVLFIVILLAAAVPLAFWLMDNHDYTNHLEDQANYWELEAKFQREGSKRAIDNTSSVANDARAGRA